MLYEINWGKEIKTYKDQKEKKEKRMVLVTTTPIRPRKYTTKDGLRGLRFSHPRNRRKQWWTDLVLYVCLLVFTYLFVSFT